MKTLEFLALFCPQTLYNSQTKATNTVTMDTFESKFPASSFILPLSPNLCYKLVNLMFSTPTPR